jgi:uncharacterized protein (TIGR01619 family)
MSDRWNSYICKVNDKLASIFVDLGIRQTVPDEGRPWLLWVWVYFRQSRPDGLSSSQEFETLACLEDKLVTALEQKCHAVLSGRITTNGRREFYFYGAQPEDFDDAVRYSMGAFHGYKFEFDKQQDPDWTQYLNVLYPSEEQLEQIKNRELMDVLKLKGDKLESARDVRHWAYFKNQTDRETFRAAVQVLGYRILSEKENPESDSRFGICVERMQDMAPDAVDTAVIELFRASKSAHGEYDGWECQLIVATKPESKKSRWKFW